LSELETQSAVHEVFLEDTKSAFSKMLGAQEVCCCFFFEDDLSDKQHDKKRAAEKKEAETTKTVAVQVDDLLSFRQFSKKTADDAIDVSVDLSLIFTDS
jgi:coatomer subunit beta